MASLQREYAIVVFGASGFTGQFVVREVAKNCRGQFKWAVAGRNQGKLEKVLQETANEMDRDLTDEAHIIIADVNDEESLNIMCSRAKIILNCVGPYRFYGEPVVKAAVENQCHHLDVSGEPEFLETMQLKYHDQALQNNVHVIGTCGFDSIPADMGVVFATEQFPGELCQLESFMTFHTGPKGFVGHYGTYQSIIHGIASNFEGNLKKIRRQIYPSPMPTFGPKLKKRGAVFYSNEINKWCIPFLGSDVSVVRRSQRHRVQVLKENAIQYGAYMGLPSLVAILLLMFFGAIFALLCRFQWGRNLLEKHPRFFSFGMFSHEGPTKQQREETSFSFLFCGAGYGKKTAGLRPLPAKPDSQIVVKVNGPEAGYVATPICMVQAAMTILEDKLPNKGGVLTPAAAFSGTSLIDRLNKNGVKFSVVSTTLAE
ncbi:saccharopine dehydrogenase-like oxidoreductase [Actinia tenebrosa]|uniref:Saccharopine dehydrogenase-like oxidoreductase n=1 Tax=Actinia tenebrosa TaxID=6105 RepID=A0A6P8HSK2_ACTTE|nr:saccharopine dehydrogenase-like oxidoreductase [Actinia tenebrosa]